MPIQVRFLRSIRLFVAVATGVALLTVLAASSAVAAETKTFRGQKTCSGLLPTTPPTQTCIINPSSLEILEGATVHYTHIVFYNNAGAVVPPGSPAAIYLSSPVRLTAIDKKGSTAAGQCTFYIAGPKAGTGHCEWVSGTGKLTGFHSNWVVGTVNATAMVYSLKGPYWFDRHDNGEGDNGGD